MPLTAETLPASKVKNDHIDAGKFADCVLLYCLMPVLMSASAQI